MVGPRPELPARQLHDTGSQISGPSAPQLPQPPPRAPPAALPFGLHLAWPPQGNSLTYQVIQQPLSMAQLPVRPPLSQVHGHGMPHLMPPSAPVPQVRPVLYSQAPRLAQRPSSTRSLCSGCKAPLRGHPKPWHQRCPQRPCEKCRRPYTMHRFGEAGESCEREPLP